MLALNLFSLLDVRVTVTVVIALSSFVYSSVSLLVSGWHASSHTPMMSISGGFPVVEGLKPSRSLPGIPILLWVAVLSRDSNLFGPT